MLLAAESGQETKFIKACRCPGADINYADGKGQTSLFLASMHGRLEVVKFLLAKPGIDVNQADTDGATPLFQVENVVYCLF